MGDVLSCILAPVIIGELLLNELLQINGLVELVCFCTRIADETFRVKTLCDLENVSINKCQVPRNSDVPS